MRELKSHGSTKLVAVSSSVRKRPRTSSGGPHEFRDGDGDKKRHDEAGCGSDVGDDAKDRGEDSPESGVGDADEEEAEAEEGSVGCVYGGLKDEVLADAVGGILDGLGHEADATHAGEEEDAMAELLALHEEVDGEDDDDAADSDGAEEAHEKFCGGLELGAVGIDEADGLGFGVGSPGFGGCVAGGVGEVVGDALDGDDCVGDGFLGREMDGGYFL